jgi:hypothetical protein
MWQDTEGSKSLLDGLPMMRESQLESSFSQDAQKKLFSLPISYELIVRTTPELDGFLFGLADSTGKVLLHGVRCSLKKADSRTFLVKFQLVGLPEIQSYRLFISMRKGSLQQSIFTQSFSIEFCPRKRKVECLAADISSNSLPPSSAQKRQFLGSLYQSLTHEDQLAVQSHRETLLSVKG